MIRGRQLSRDTEHRVALRRNMVQSLFEHGKIRTTLPKAKEVRGFAEKLITLARTDSVNNRRRVIQLMQDRRLVDEKQEFTGDMIVNKLFKEVAPKFVGRDGGYTRIIKLSEYRIGDGGDIVILQLLADESAPTGTVRRSAGLRRKRNARKVEYASRLLKLRKGGEASTASAAAPATENPPTE
jgi:large subunit ribosomal protein L17